MSLASVETSTLVVEKVNSEKVGGSDSSPTFKTLTSISIEDEPLKFKTFVTEEMLKRGYLFSNLFYASVLHTPDIIDECVRNIRSVLTHQGELKLNNSGEYFCGTICHSTFERIN